MPTSKRTAKNITAKKRSTTSKAVPPPPGPEVSWQEQAAYFDKYSWEQIEKAGHTRPSRKTETAWVNKVSAKDRKRVAARPSRTQLNLALSADQLTRFTQYAKKKHIPPSTLARAWVLERLDLEATETP